MIELPAVPMRSKGTALALSRPERHVQLQQRSFTAAATPIDVSNRTEAQRLKKLRQPWQEEAWEYRDAIGELRYATTYLGNSARRMVLIPSAYVDGELNPVPLIDIDECPPEVLSAAQDALERLAVGGAVALGGMLASLTENFEVAGECYLVGMEVEGEETWEIRSISEIGIDNDGRLVLKDVEAYGGSTGQGEPLPPDAFISRLWWPHPRRKAFADSPFKSILDVAEELLILSRDIRAAGRSRLASNGILLVPDSLTVIRSDTEEDVNNAETSDPFLSQLIAAAMAAIQDEGSASAVLPLVARGPADALAAVRQITISRNDPSNKDKRQELITRMATGLDLPAEVLTGKSDLNHWTAWQVSDDTFRHHIEPIVMVEVDALTLGYYKPELKARSVPPEWLSRIVLWYDPTNLVTHPDRTQDAMNAYDRNALSSESLRDYMGFEETDAPTNDEILLKLLSKQTRLDPTIIAQIIKRVDSSIDVSQVRPETRPVPMAPGPGAPAPKPPAPVDETPAETGSPAALPASASETLAERVILSLLRGGKPETVVASAARVPNRDNQKLLDIDRELRTRLHQAMNDHMARALDRAGAKIRTKMTRTADGRQWLEKHPCKSNSELARHPGSLVAAGGFDEHELLSAAWDDLEPLWNEYVHTSQLSLMRQLAKMTGLDINTVSAQIGSVLDDAAGESWAYAKSSLMDTAMKYLSDSIHNKPDEITSTNLVDMSVARESVAIAGGSGLTDPTSAGLNVGDDMSVGVTPQLSSGPISSGIMGDNGIAAVGYTWVHGFVPNPFDPHVELDGVEFSSWTDDVLANNDSWPDVDFFMPGDHDGCSCDFMIAWGGSEQGLEEE
jgi:hypothetical protein